MLLRQLRHGRPLAGAPGRRLWRSPARTLTPACEIHTVQSRHARILVTGNTVIDTVMDVPEMPVDDKVFVDAKRRFVGGQGANAAQAMALLGLDVSFLTRIGDDSDGRFAHRHFKAMGLDTAHCLVTPGTATMSACVVVSTALQQRACLMHRDRRMFELDLSSEVRKVDLGRYDALYTDGHQLDLVLPLVRLAVQRGLPVVADVEVLDDSTRELASLADELIAPAKNVCILAGCEDPQEAVLRLADRPGRTVVATAGAGGSYGARHGDAEASFMPAKACTVRDTTGAGDAYHAGFLAAKVRNQAASLEESMDFATRVAAALCETHGPVVCPQALKRFGCI